MGKGRGRVWGRSRGRVWGRSRGRVWGRGRGVVWGRGRGRVKRAASTPAAQSCRRSASAMRPPRKCAPG